MLEVKDRYDEIFGVEMEGWCYGIQNYPGEVFPALVHAVIRELAPSFKLAVEHNLAFDILELSKQFSKAAKYLIHEKEVTFSILARLPNPACLDEDGQFVLAQIIDQVEQSYGGAIERLQKKWAWEKKQAA